MNILGIILPCFSYKESVGANVQKKDNSCVPSGGVCKRSCRAPLPEGECPGQQVCCSQRRSLAKGGDSNRGKNLASRREKARNNKRNFRQQKGKDKTNKKGTDRKNRKKDDRNTQKQQQRKDVEKNQKRNKNNSKANRGPRKHNKKPKGKNSGENEDARDGRKKNKVKPNKAKGQGKKPEAVDVQRSGEKVASKDTDGGKRICKRTLGKCRKQGGKCVETGTCATQTLEGGCQGFSCECCLPAGMYYGMNVKE